MGRKYTAQFTGVAVTAQQDLFELNAPSDAVVVVHELHLSQSTEVGDAQEEGLSILLKSGQTTSGSGGSAPTAVPVEFGDAAFGGTVEVNNTTKASAGTIVTHHPWNWNVRMPFDKIWTPETRPILSPSRRATVELATTPADSITMSGSMTIEEIGG
ncbi:MAG: hypothetical protein ACREMX_04450 [Gemmatimonadales bacterium]